MAQTLKFGNKTWATKVGSTLAYNDENGNYKPLPFAFTRSTSATRVNKEGLIEVVTNDRPRIDYTDTSDGVLLLEKAATNLITYSEDFSNASWSSDTPITLTNNSTTSPDGTQNAAKIEYNGGVGYTYFRVQYAAAVGVFSIYAKKGNWRYLGIRNNDGGSHSVWDFDTETFSNVQTNHTMSFDKLGDGWYRISDYVSVDSASTYRGVAITDATGAETNTLAPAGSYVYIWGGQGENSASYPTSYIPTQGSATTRVAETASGSGNSEVFNDSQGVLFIDTAANSDDGTSRRISVSDGSSNPNNLVCLDMSEYTNQIIGRVRTGNTEVAFLVSESQNQTQKNKIAVKYKVNDFALWINGFEVDTDNNGSTPIGLNDLSFDRGNGNNDFYGKTKEIGYYDTILTDLELETLTSYKSWTSMVNELNLNIIYNG